MKERTYTKELHWFDDIFKGFVEITKNRKWSSIRWSIDSLDNRMDVSDFFADNQPIFAEQILEITHSFDLPRHYYAIFCERWGEITGLPHDACLELQTLILSRWNLLIDKWNRSYPELDKFINFQGGPEDGQNGTLETRTIARLKDDQILTVDSARYKLTQKDLDTKSITYEATYIGPKN